jgi:hypothetical protein
MMGSIFAKLGSLLYWLVGWKLTGCRENITVVYLHIGACRYSMVCVLHGCEKFVIMAPSDSILYAAYQYISTISPALFGSHGMSADACSCRQW